MKYILLIISFVFFHIQIFAQDLIISEIVADNTSGYTNANGKTPDWIEVKNVSNATINLSDYKLADKNGFVTPWQLPDITLAAGAYYLIEASAPNNIVAQWETIIDKGENWKYLIPLSEPDPTWKSIGFNDATWSVGPSGFGFADNDDATIIPMNTSVFIRKTFTITDKSDISDAFLHMDYDDGFVAYLNGTEIARAAMSGYPPVYNELATFGHEALWYQNLPIEKFSVADIQNLIQVGENVLTIQIHNNAVASSDLTAIPIFTLGYSQNHTITNGISSFISIGAISSQANFKINADNETVYLLKNTTIIDSISINNLPHDISIGRINNDIHSLRYFSTPTPGAANSVISLNPETLSKPTVSKNGCVFNSKFYLKVYSDQDGVSIYYTINGSDPTDASLKFTDSLYINKTTNLKLRVYKTGYLPSEVKTESYIYLTRTQNLPIVSITVKNEDFFDWNTGIYVKGPNAEEAQPNFGANFWEDWERPAHIEIIETNGETALSMDLGVKIQGNWSRAQPQKSLKFYSRSEYGDKTINYQIFKDKPLYEFQTFILRNSGNDFNNTQMRDGMIQTLCRNMGMDRMAYRPAIVYINGVYYGIQNFREKINEDFIAQNNGVNKDSISLINNIGEVVFGSAQNFTDLYAFMSNNDLSIPANYERVKQDLDVESFIKFNVVELFVVNQDWPGNNTKLWRENNSNGRWRYILYDLDFGFGIWDAGKVNINMLDWALNSIEPAPGEWMPNAPWATLMLRKLTQNTEFNTLFMNHMADRLNTTFSPDSITKHIDSLASAIIPELGYHAQKWGGDADYMMGNIQGMKDFGNERGDIIRTDFEERFNTNGSYLLTITTSTPKAGRIHLNSIDLTSFPWSGKYFKNVPITLTAIPAPGYTFVRWEGAVSSTNPTIQITTDIATTVNAVYTYNVSDVPNIFISEINYNSADTLQTGDWIEIYNKSTSSQDISSWIIKDKSEFNTFTIPVNTVIPANSYVVVCSDTTKFYQTYSHSIRTIGNIPFSLSKSIETIRLINNNGFVIDKLSYSDNLPWPKKCDGYGYSLELNNINGDRTNPLIWRAATKKGNPGSANNSISLTANRDKITINEINFNSNSNSDNGDWFELYNAGNTFVNISEWVIRDNDNTIFIVPPFTAIPAKSYLVFVDKPELFQIIHPDVSFIPVNIGLKSSFDGLRLFDQYEFLIDSIEYSIFDSNVIDANGTGKTLALLSSDLDNSNIQNWSYGVNNGTPGKANEFFDTEINVVKNKSDLVLYPNPCEDYINVQIDKSFSFDIYNVAGVKILSQEFCKSPIISTEKLNPGIYFIRINTENQFYYKIFEKKQ